MILMPEVLDLSEKILTAKQNKTKTQHVIFPIQKQFLTKVLNKINIRAMIFEMLKTKEGNTPTRHTRVL